MTAQCVMVLGTTSGAGKSWLTTALCRHYARQGLKVAPFKAQNMSNNARVVAGGEIGSAQYFQALAARAEPDVRMNPLLLKPEADTRSQVVLMGQVRADLTTMPWRERSALLWPTAREALANRIRSQLAGEGICAASYDVVVVGGGGAGLRAAIAAVQSDAGLQVALVSKVVPMRSASRLLVSVLM